jgi:hypothetical protein
MATVKWTDSIIVLGGLSDHDEPLNKVSMYNVKTQESQMLPPMLTKRVGCGAVAMDGSTIIVVGGKNGASEIFNSVESFNNRSKYCRFGVNPNSVGDKTDIRQRSNVPYKCC